MKLFTTLMAVTLLAAACGKSQSSSEVNTASENPKYHKRIAAPVKGYLESVAVQSARGPAVGIWTNVNVGFMIGCSDSFETFSYKIDRLSNGVSIDISAIVSRPSADQLVCQAFSNITKTITLPGVYSESDIKLNFMTGASKAIPAQTTSLKIVQDLFVISTRPLCPEGAKCVLNGTAVTVGTYLGCVDKMGPVTYKSETAPDGALTLKVNAINFYNEMSRLTRCAVANIGTAEIQLINQYTDKESLRLSIVK